MYVPVFVYFMLLTYTLQEGGVITNQASSQPIRERSYTVGRSYDTASGKVVTMTTRDDSSDVMMMGSIMTGRQVRIIPLPTTDDVITGGPLITIREVKTPASPSEPLPHICDVVSDVISGAETRGDGDRILDLRGGKDSVLSPLTPLLSTKSPLDELSLSPAVSPGRLTGMASPSTARVVR